MKKARKFLSLLLAMAMVMAMSMTAFAADVAETFTITINTEQTGHSYAAYQIFAGDLSTDKKLSNVVWGEGVNSDALLEALQADETIGSYFEECTTARQVAEALEKDFANDAANTILFADIVGKYIGTASGTTTEDSPKAISGLEAGYYLIKDTTANILENDAASRFILKVVDDVTATVKIEVPSTDKQIVIDEDTKADDNTAKIGDDVHYEITGDVPNYTGYKYYYYIINDTLAEGLTFNHDIAVTVDGETLKKGEDYYVYENRDGYTFRVAFDDIMNYTIGDEIVVSYSAKVNEDAVIGESGNVNTTNLDYSNNPSNSEKKDKNDKPEEPDNPPTPGIPDDTVPTGETPDEKTITYVTEIDITKYADEIAAGNELPGAEFTLTGKSKKTVLAGGSYFEKNAEGDYWLLKDGTYTDEAPQKEEKNEDGEITMNSNEHLYASLTEKFAKIEATKTEIVEEDVIMIGTSDEDGKIIFKGLGEGTFTLEETKTPDGYNTAEKITVTTNATLPETVTTGEEKATWTESEDGIYYVDIVDMSGTVLPSTGGMGTTIFYLIGGLMVLCAGVLLVTKKRMAR